MILNHYPLKKVIMKNFLAAIAIIAFGLFLAVVVATSKPKPEKNKEAPRKPLQVQVQAAELRSIPVQVKSHAILEARHEFDVISEVNGSIVSVNRHFVSGGVFAANEQLLKIDDVDYQVALSEALSNVSKARELVASEKARSEQAKNEWRDLGSDDANDLFLRKPQLASAIAAEKAAKARLLQAKRNVAKTRIKFPFASRVQMIDVQKGQYVSKGNKLARIYAEGQLQATLALSQAQLKTLNISWPLASAEALNITLTAQVGNQLLQWPAKVLIGSAKIEPSNQLLELVVELETSQQQALPGLYVEAVIEGVRQDQVLLLPEDAFHDKRYVLIAKDSALEFRAAEFLSRRGDLIVVKADVKQGESVIVNRLPLASPGMAVTAVAVNADDSMAEKP